MLWTRIQGSGAAGAGWWVSAFKLLDPDSPEAVSSEETTTLAVLTRRPFRSFRNFNFVKMASPRCHATETPSTGPSERLRVLREAAAVRDGMIPRGVGPR